MSIFCSVKSFSSAPSLSWQTPIPFPSAPGTSPPRRSPLQFSQANPIALHFPLLQATPGPAAQQHFLFPLFFWPGVAAVSCSFWSLIASLFPISYFFLPSFLSFFFPYPSPHPLPSFLPFLLPFPIWCSALPSFTKQFLHSILFGISLKIPLNYLVLVGSWLTVALPVCEIYISCQDTSSEAVLSSPCVYICGGSSLG